MITKVFYDLMKHEPQRILHVGGHKGQEIPLYKQHGCDVVFVEPLPELAKTISKKGYEVLVCAIGSKRGKQKFYVSGQQSSLLPLTNKKTKEIMVDVIPLSSIEGGSVYNMLKQPRKVFDTLVIDVQGGELSVLKSGSLKEFRLIVVEVRRGNTYVGSPQPEEVKSYLEEKGFKQIGEYPRNHKPIMDLLFIRK